MGEKSIYDIRNEFNSTLNTVKDLVRCAGGGFFLVDSYKDELANIVQEIETNYIPGCADSFNQKLKEFENFEREYCML